MLTNKTHIHTLHATPLARTPEAKLAKLKRFAALYREGWRGKILAKHSGLKLDVARRWAAEVGFDLQGALGRAARPQTNQNHA